jgi:pilus assembly protein CpaE
VSGGWPERPDPGHDILIVSVVAGRADDVDAALRRLGGDRGGTQIVVALRDADVTTTRRLVRAGAADVLTAPVSEPALALCLERLLTGKASNTAPRRSTGEVVAVLKAGGGVGATALCVQMAALLAARGAGQVCLADLDLQFGAAGVYLDLPDAVTIADCLGSGSGLEDTPFASVLATHRTSVRLLAAPREIVALETLGPAQIDALLGGLRRDFALTIVDLPTAWTAWTNQVLQQADRIVLVTHLSVPHIQLVKRQLRVLASQRLDDRPLTLVCNSLSSDQTAFVPIKTAERALGRAFDLIIPEDRKVMTSALNQGVEVSAVRRGTKLEKAIAQLADKVAVSASARGAR